MDSGAHHHLHVTHGAYHCQGQHHPCREKRATKGGEKRAPKWSGIATDFMRSQYHLLQFARQILCHNGETTRPNLNDAATPKVKVVQLSVPLILDANLWSHVLLTCLGSTELRHCLSGSRCLGINSGCRCHVCSHSWQ